MAQYRFGSASIETGAQVVTFKGAELEGNVQPGHLFSFTGENVWYEIIAVDPENSTVTLNSLYTGATKVDQPYAIHQTFTPVLKIPTLSYGDENTAGLLAQAFGTLDASLYTLGAGGGLLDGVASPTWTLSKHFAGAPSKMAGLIIERGVETDASILFRDDLPTKRWEISHEASVASHLSVGGNLNVAGNLVVEGDTVVLNTSTIDVEDTIITVGKANTGVAPFLGLKLERGGSDAFFVWDESTDRLTAYTSSNDLATKAKAPIEASTFYGPVEGNATSASKLQTARTIALSGDVTAVGVGFDGTGNITIATTLPALSGLTAGKYGHVTVNTKGQVTAIEALAAGHISAALGYTPFNFADSTSANTANTVVRRDANGNFVAGTITAALSGNASTATKLQTTRAFSATGDATAPAVNFDGSGNVALTLTLANSGVTAGTYSNLTVDAKGRVTSARALSSADVTTALGYTPLDNKGGTITGNLTVTGDLTVQGDTIFLDVGSVRIEDTILEVAKANTGSAPYGGIKMERGGTDAFWVFDEATDRWTALTSGNDLSSAGTKGDVEAANFHGALKGNADTATKLATARTIALSGAATASGVAFDGSGNISLNVTSLDATKLTGTVPLSSITISTSNVSEGTNLYYTDARARAALSGSNGISYDAATGVISGANFAQKGTANTFTGANTFSGSVTLDGATTFRRTGAKNDLTISLTNETIANTFWSRVSIIKPGSTSNENRLYFRFHRGSDGGIRDGLVIDAEAQSVRVFGSEVWTQGALASTDNLPEGSTNKYYTDARATAAARAAVKAGAGLSYDPATGTFTNTFATAAVTSVAGRTGDVTLTSADITDWATAVGNQLSNKADKNNPAFTGNELSGTFGSGGARFRVAGTTDGRIYIQAGDPTGDDSGGKMALSGYLGTDLDTLEIFSKAVTLTSNLNFRDELEGVVLSHGGKLADQNSSGLNGSGRTVLYANNNSFHVLNEVGTAAIATIDTSGMTLNGNTVYHSGNLSLSSYTGDLSGANQTLSGSLSFGAVTRQMLNLWNTNYGIGVQSSTLYLRTGGAFALYNGGSHATSQFDAGGGSLLMKIDAGGNLSAKGTITSETPNGLRIKTSAGATGRGLILRNDSNSTWFLVTNDGDADGAYNSLRPLSFNNSTGVVSMGHGLTVTAGGITIQNAGLDVQHTNGIATRGGLTVGVGQGSSIISMRGGTNGGVTRYVHHDGNVIGFLGSGGGWAAYFPDNGDMWIQHRQGHLSTWMAEKANLNSPSFSGRVYAGAMSGQMVNGYNNASLEIRSTGGTGDWDMACISFHAVNYYGIQLGLRADGYFGLGGWSSGAWRWYSTPDGTMVASGNIAAYSDPRLKDDVERISGALGIVRSLNGVRFTWNNRTKLIGRPGERDIGILADQVEAVLPEIVRLSIEDAENDNERWKVVDYDKLSPVIIEAVKELDDKVIAQAGEIAALRAENDNLKAEHESLKTQMAFVMARLAAAGI